MFTGMWFSWGTTLDCHSEGFELDLWSDVCVGFSAYGLSRSSLPKIKLPGM
jgi:hypothetical protein